MCVVAFEFNADRIFIRSDHNFMVVHYACNELKDWNRILHTIIITMKASLYSKREVQFSSP